MTNDRPPATNEASADDGARVSDLDALTLLYELADRCLRSSDDFDGCLDAMVDAAIVLTTADKATLHLVDRKTSRLVMQTHRGFDRESVEFFSQLNARTASDCSATPGVPGRMMLEEVTTAGEPAAPQTSADVLLAQGVRAVQSAPLVSSTGSVLGIISIHFMRPVRLAERELRLLDLLGRQAAYYLERKERERQLLDSRLQLARITAHAGVVITQCDRDLRYLFVNERLTEFLGRTAGQMIGRSVPEVIGEPAFQVLRPYIDRVLGGERVEFEAQVPYAGVGLRYVHIIYVPDVDSRGAVCGWIETISDISERRGLEEHLRVADRHKDEFLAMLAHELRNALAPIRYALATTQKSGRTPEQLARAEGVIERQVSHMARLVDDLLDVSRITREKIELKKVSIDLASILGSAVEAARPIIEAKRHTLCLDLPQQPLRMEADPVRLAQVFSNLLINAAKYTDPGGRIELRALQEPGALIVSVRDNGIGISAEVLPRLFTLFAQSRATAGRSEGGLGIGLALVRGIVELHGGRVEASSAGPEQGSEFIVRLPLGWIQPRAQDTVAAPCKAPGSRLRILIADDNRAAADTCGALLELSGHCVRIAYTGLGALELADVFRPDALVLDIGLPDMDGYVIAERVRESVWGKAAVLVAVTGFGQEEDRKRAFAAGFDHHLTKPVTGAALEALLDSVNVAPPSAGTPPDNRA